ncbi:deoxyribonuclease V [Chitinophaga pinensis]|uniref:Endonuclease V n=1 Tax=Chitinophaga pinensis TaxID=79329 RepID=A0A5C6LW79_9BACT|nr:deoxyribonuclease V [Chitinophaga pinensis]TWW01513.1 deoxyribonuclease V [Chitinophaga pinensis]
MNNILTEQEAIQLQEELRSRVIRTDQLSADIKLIAGVDVEYDKESDLIAGAFVLLDFNTLEVVEVATHCMQVTFPYIPGLFSFREMPVLLEAWKKLERRPDIIVCDGQGLAHPRRFGLACHMGVLLDVPTLGCGKTRLFGKYEALAAERGAVSPLLAEDNGEHIGNALRTQNGISPVFVSTGHKISLETATALVLKMCVSYRLPETTRKADHYGREAFIAFRENEGKALL